MLHQMAPVMGFYNRIDINQCGDGIVPGSIRNQAAPWGKRCQSERETSSKPLRIVMKGLFVMAIK
jgi:hypothetical protein